MIQGAGKRSERFILNVSGGRGMRRKLQAQAENMKGDCHTSIRGIERIPVAS